MQEAFLRFYVAMLQDYRKYLPTDVVDQRSSWRGKEGVSDLRFKTDGKMLTWRSELWCFCL